MLRRPALVMPRPFWCGAVLLAIAIWRALQMTNMPTVNHSPGEVVVARQIDAVTLELTNGVRVRLLGVVPADETVNAEALPLPDLSGSRLIMNFDVHRITTDGTLLVLLERDGDLLNETWLQNGWGQFDRTTPMSSQLAKRLKSAQR